MRKKMPKERRIANCLGEQNLAKAIDALEEEGFDIEFIVFTGVVIIPIPADIIKIGPDQGGQQVSKYTVIGVKFDA